MGTTESQAASEATSTSPASETPARLVIRVKIPQASASTEAPASRRLNRRVLVLMLVVAATLMLIWVGIGVFRSDPTSIPTVNEGPARAAPQSRARAPTQTETKRVISEERPTPAPSIAESQTAGDVSGEPRSATPSSSASVVQEQSDASPSPINEVLPDPPQSALDTIRGTVRVTIRVIIDKNGMVSAAKSENPGPSRYFERLSLEAAKKWTFTPATAQTPRVMLLKFHFTREGTTASAQAPQ